MNLTKKGKPDKRFKKTTTKLSDIDPDLIDLVKPVAELLDPNELHTKLLKDNNLKLDFDVLEGTIATKYGIIKLEKPTLVIKASYK